MYLHGANDITDRCRERRIALHFAHARKMARPPCTLCRDAGNRDEGIRESCAARSARKSS